MGSVRTLVTWCISLPQVRDEPARVEGNAQTIVFMHRAKSCLGYKFANGRKERERKITGRTVGSLSFCSVLSSLFLVVPTLH